jgi:hypothetical protein
MDRVVLDTDISSLILKRRLPSPVLTRLIGKQPCVTPDPRNVVQSQDALDAVLQLAAVIDEATQAGRIEQERGKHAATMLMVIRDFIKPLPRGLAPDGVTDNLTRDLEEIVAALRQARQDTGLAG